MLAIPRLIGLTRSKQLSMAANILSAIFVLYFLAVIGLIPNVYRCRPCALSVAI